MDLQVNSSHYLLQSLEQNLHTKKLVDKHKGYLQITVVNPFIPLV